MSPLPLNDRGVVSNSVGAFMYRHPELDDIIDAYNLWVEENKDMAFPWGEPWLPQFVLELLDMCINKLSRHMVAAFYYQERMAHVVEDYEITMALND